MSYQLANNLYCESIIFIMKKKSALQGRKGVQDTLSVQRLQPHNHNI